MEAAAHLVPKPLLLQPVDVFRSSHASLCHRRPRRPLKLLRRCRPASNSRSHLQPQQLTTPRLSASHRLSLANQHLGNLRATPPSTRESPLAAKNNCWPDASPPEPIQKKPVPWRSPLSIPLLHVAETPVCSNLPAASWVSAPSRTATQPFASHCRATAHRPCCRKSFSWPCTTPSPPGSSPPADHALPDRARPAPRELASVFPMQNPVKLPFLPLN